MPQLDLSIIIVNYNGGNLILSCIETVFRETKKYSYKIIVIDNNSTDDSIRNIRVKYPQVLVIENHANLGFAAANNIGFQEANSRYVLLLNPDTRIINGAIDSALSYIESNHEVGALGCKVLLDNGIRQSTLIRFPSLLDTFINIFVPNRFMRDSKFFGRSRYVGIDEDLERDVDAIAGCFMLLPTDVINEVGDMDDEFFMFGEEVEWCHRISKYGKKIRYFPGCTIIHHGGGCSESLSYRKVLLIAKGQLLVLKKTKGPIIAYISNILMLVRDIPRTVLWLILWLISRKKASSIYSLKASSIRIKFHFLYLVGINQTV